MLKWKQIAIKKKFNYNYSEIVESAFSFKFEDFNKHCKKWEDRH